MQRRRRDELGKNRKEREIVRSIAITSGKGGVGKSTTAINIGILLAQAGKKTVVVDADVSMANVGIMLGVERAPISLHNVLMGESDVMDAVYEGPSKMKYVPSGLSIDRVKKIDFKKFADAINELESTFDYVIVDSPPGLHKQEESIIKSCRETILLVAPEPTSLADALKIKNFADKNGIKVLGMVMTRTLHDPAEIKQADLEAVLGLKLIAEIPEDAEVRRSNALQQPVVIKAPNSPSARAYRRIASFLAGEALPEETKVKKGFLAGILESLFGKK